MRVAVVGPGAIGLSFGAAAAQAGQDVVICARRPVPEALVARRPGRPTIEVRAPVVLDPAGAPADVDLVLLAVKAHQTAGAAGWLARLCGPRRSWRCCRTASSSAPSSSRWPARRP